MNDDDHEQFTERWLDQALARYSEHEPRAGFEDRILAGLAAHKVERVPAWRRFAWVPVACTAALALVAGLSMLRKTERPPKPPVAAPTLTRRIPDHVAADIATFAPPKRVVHRRHVESPGASVVKVFPPRQTRFPAPAQPTEQERLLMAYLNVTPRHELLAVAADQQAWRDHEQQNKDVDSRKAARRGKTHSQPSSAVDTSSRETDAFDIP